VFTRAAYPTLDSAGGVTAGVSGFA